MLLLARVCEKAIIGPEASMFVPCLTNFLLLLYYTRTSNSQTHRLLQFISKVQRFNLQSQSQISQIKNISIKIIEIAAE